MCYLMAELTKLMNLTPGQQPTLEKVRAIKHCAAAISTIAVGEGYEH
jgi:hypothetical protein